MRPSRRIASRQALVQARERHLHIARRQLHDLRHYEQTRVTDSRASAARLGLGRRSKVHGQDIREEPANTLVIPAKAEAHFNSRRLVNPF